MLPVEQQRADRLVALARERFDQDLRPIEEQVLRHSCGFEDPPDWVEPAQNGQVDAQLPDSAPDIGPQGRPLAEWEGPELRPDFLRWLVTDTEATDLVEARGVRVWNARIREVLDLRGCQIPTRVEFRYCSFAEQINLISTELLSLYVRDSTLQKGMEASRARLHGPLFLQNVAVDGPLSFSFTTVEGEFYLGDATLSSSGVALSLRGAAVSNDICLKPNLKCSGQISLFGISVGGHIDLSGAKLTYSETAVSLDNAKVRGNVLLARNFESNGRVSMLGAEIGGQLNCIGAKLKYTDTELSTSKDGLTLEQATIHGSVFLSSAFESSGRLNMLGVEIGGQLNCTGAKLTTSKEALSLEQATIRGGVVMMDPFESAGTINLRGSDIDVGLNCTGAKFNALESAVVLDQVKVRGAVFLRDIQCAGQIRMLAAEIYELDCKGAKFKATGTALELSQTKIGGKVVLDGFETSGKVSMIGAEVGGQLNCTAAHFTKSENALFLDQAKIAGGVYLRSAQSAGLIRMVDAEIGNLECTGAKLTENPDALFLDRAKILGSVKLNNGFESTGLIRMVGAVIDGQLECDQASIRSLMGEGMVVKGDFFWRRIRNPEQSALNLTGASIKVLRDDDESCPKKGNLRLNGLIVGDLSPLEPRALFNTGRIEWLSRQPNEELTEPQPWMQLAKLLKDKGHERESRRVVRELNTYQAIAQWKNHPIRRELAIRYARLKEEPLRILWSVFVLAAIFGLIFLFYKKDFAPTDGAAYARATQPAPQKGEPSQAYPKFEPIVYALENELPAVRLGQDDHWGPDPNHLRAPGWLYWLLMGMRWILIVAGYVQGVALAAAVSSRFRS